MWRLTRYGLVFIAGQVFQILSESYQVRQSVARLVGECDRDKVAEIKQRWRDLFDAR